MSSDSIVTESNADKNKRKILLSVTRGLKAIFVPNTIESKLRRNFAWRGIPAKIIGIPEISADSTRFKGGVNFLQTKVGESEVFTIMSAHKNATVPTGAINGCMVSATYRSPLADDPTTLTYGCSLYSLNNTSLSLGATRNNSGKLTSGGSTLNEIDTENWGLYSATVDVSANTICSHSQNKSNTAHFPTSSRELTTGKFTIGSNQNEDETYTGEVDVAFWLYANEVWTEEERELVASDIRNIVAQLGITV